MVASSGLVAILAIPAFADNSGQSASGWHIGYYNPSNRALSNAEAPSAPGGVASLNFTNQPNTALLTTDQKAKNPSLLGDLTGKTVSASFALTGLSTSHPVIYYNEPDACGGTTAYVRYFFDTVNSGGFNETNYWWSNPTSLPLTVDGTYSIPPVSLIGANWSDYYGHFGTNANSDGFNGAAGFKFAVGHVTNMGLSFGGGCFFENGVGTNDGSGTFTLNTFTVKP